MDKFIQGRVFFRKQTRWNHSDGIPLSLCMQFYFEIKVDNKPDKEEWNKQFICANTFFENSGVTGVIRVVQNKIYTLYDTFDNDRFRDEYMFEDKGHAFESYHDCESKANIWRSVIDEKVEEICKEFMEKTEEMKLRAKKMKCEVFILSPLHSGSEFYNESTKKEATGKLAERAEERACGDSKKRKSLA